MSHDEEPNPGEMMLSAKQRVRITLSDGQTMIGRVKCKDQQCRITSSNGLKIEIDRSSITRIDELSAREKNPHFDANRTRYLYSPSAFSLKTGEGYLSQKELFFTSVAYGVTDHLTIIGGAALPLWLGDAFNIILGAKYSFDLDDHLRMAAGAETFNFPTASFGLILSFVGLTLGDEEAHVTFNAGKPFAYSGNSDNIPENSSAFMLSLSANKKLSKSARLITENWLFLSINQPRSNLTLNSLALRLQGESLAVDLGGILLGSDGDIFPIPIPWLDFAYNF